jgi:type II secretory pathway pseudopilin PulG
MVVVAVIGVGAGVALFNMSEQVAEARAQADGEAMAQHIQTEQRAARQRMVGLRLRRDTSHTKLTFEEVNRCADSAPMRSRPRQFLPTTKLEISTNADSVCWERNGEIAVGGGVGLPPGLNNVNNTPGVGDTTLELTVKAGIMRQREKKLRSTRAGPLVPDLTTAAPNR